MTSGDAMPPRMLIGRDRLFYTGLLGNSMKTRRLGAASIYVATGGDLAIKVGEGPWTSRQIVALPPFTPHRLHSPGGYITNICLESASIDAQNVAELIAAINGRQGGGMIRRIMDGRREIGRMRAAGFSASEFDQLFLGQALRPRPVDQRVRQIADRLVDELQDCAVTAQACARDVGLSTSRFLHLFKENTGIPFRSQRMWRRARRFMDHVDGDDSLTGVALDLGYPDSSHFSHSIRACYGLQPRSIREGSRGMKVCRGENYAVPAGL